MAFNFLKKSGKGKPKKEAVKKTVSGKANEEVAEKNDKKTAALGVSPDAYKVIQHLYISEKNTMLADQNKYVFKVQPDANKTEIKKYVEKVYNVKVADVNVLNTPKKRRDIGKHPGFRGGFRKAFVTLKEGSVIEQAKP